MIHRIYSPLFAAVLCVVGGDAFGQTYPQWGALEPGPYDVGFRAVHTVDHSRGYWPKVDAQGRRDPLETARPMQISLWYPADPDARADRMAFGEYIDLTASALGPERVTPERRAEAVESLRRGPLNPYFPDGVSDADLRRVLDTPTAAVLDAAPAPGRLGAVPGLQEGEDPDFPADQTYTPPETDPLSVEGVRETSTELVAVRLNPWWYPHDIYAPPDAGSGGPFTIGRVIHSARSVGFTGWIGGVAVFDRALSFEELAALTAPARSGPIPAPAD